MKHVTMHLEKEKRKEAEPIRSNASSINETSAPRGFKCSVEGCNKSYSNSSHLKRHVKTSHNPNEGHHAYTCDECQKVFKTIDTLWKHFSRTHDCQVYKCQVCLSTFRSEKHLQSHKQRCHRNQTSHRCEKCKITFLRIGYYNRHMRGHRLHFCKHTGCLFATDKYALLRKHLAHAHPRLLECATCGKKVKDKSLIRKHVRVHLYAQGLLKQRKHKTNAGPRFPCDICGGSFTTKGSLKRHIKVMHETPQEVKLARQVKHGIEKIKKKAERKDKGIPKSSIAAFLSGINLPLSIEKALIKKTEYSSSDSTSKQIFDLMKRDMKQITQEEHVSSFMDEESSHQNREG